MPPDRTSETANDSTYQFYAIIARARTGSNLLSRSLNNHRNVVCYSEPFKQDFQIPNSKLHRRYPDLKEIHDRDLIEYLTFLFDNCPKASATTLGIKEFFYSPKNPSRRNVWEHLRRLPGIKFIHVIRENYLELYLSQIYAIKTDTWFERQGRPNDSEDIVISPEECEKFFADYENYIERTRTFIGSAPVLEVTYGDLERDYQNTLSRVWKFLGVSDMQMTPPLTKQAHRKASEKIKNFSDLEQYFAGTRWRRFFL